MENNPYLVCRVSAAPIRAEPRDAAEMISQIIFGERCELIDKHLQWLKIRSKNDGYEGWLDQKQVMPISEEIYNESQSPMVQDLFLILMDKQNQPLTITLGSELPGLQGNDLVWGAETFKLNIPMNKEIPAKETITDTAKKYIHAPYLWGGRSPFGVDCSGLVQQVYKMHGISLPRDSYQQAEHGETLGFIEEAKPGDLAFFDNEEGRIIHVGIILKEGKILHAHGRVRMDPLDSTGIFNTDYQNYSHKLRFVKRI